MCIYINIYTCVVYIGRVEGRYRPKPPGERALPDRRDRVHHHPVPHRDALDRHRPGGHVLHNRNRRSELGNNAEIFEILHKYMKYQKYMKD